MGEDKMGEKVKYWVLQLKLDSTEIKMETEDYAEALSEAEVIHRRDFGIFPVAVVEVKKVYARKNHWCDDGQGPVSAPYRMHRNEVQADDSAEI